MAEREKIYPGDTMPVTYEVRRRDPDNPNSPDGIPATPASAHARLFDQGSSEFVELGGTGEETAPCTIVPQEGVTYRDRGALVSFTVTSEFTMTPGRYTLLITFVFSDGVTLTEDKRFQILEIL